MVIHENPGENFRAGIVYNSPQAIKERFPVRIPPENRRTFNPSDHDMMQSTRSIQSGLSWHIPLLAYSSEKKSEYFKQRPSNY